jgi:hypothetical protein
LHIFGALPGADLLRRAGRRGYTPWRSRRCGLRLQSFSLHPPRPPNTVRFCSPPTLASRHSSSRIRGTGGSTWRTIERSGASATSPAPGAEFEREPSRSIPLPRCRTSILSRVSGSGASTIRSRAASAVKEPALYLWSPRILASRDQPRSSVRIAHACSARRSPRHYAVRSLPRNSSSDRTSICD